MLVVNNFRFTKNSRFKNRKGKNIENRNAYFFTGTFTAGVNSKIKVSLGSHSAVKLLLFRTFYYILELNRKKKICKISCTYFNIRLIFGFVLEIELSGNAFLKKVNSERKEKNVCKRSPQKVMGKSVQDVG